MRLTEDMIRITNAAIGSNGRAVRDRRLVVYINGTITLKDKRGRQRRFARRGAAYKAAQKYIIEHNQRELPACAESMGCLCMCHAAGLAGTEPCDTSEVRARQLDLYLNGGGSVYVVATANGERDWCADDAEHAREQHEDAFSGQPGEQIRSIRLVATRRPS